jgi:hypothetical protein
VIAQDIEEFLVRGAAWYELVSGKALPDLCYFSGIYGKKFDRRYLRGIALTCKPNPVIKG